MQIAQAIGVSRQRIHQQLRHALAKIRSRNSQIVARFPDIFCRIAPPA